MEQMTSEFRCFVVGTAIFAGNLASPCHPYCSFQTLQFSNSHEDLQLSVRCPRLGSFLSCCPEGSTTTVTSIAEEVASTFVVDLRQHHPREKISLALMEFALEVQGQGLSFS